MFSNLFFAFQYDKPGVKRSLFWEWLHGSLLAAPSGILLVVIWELFKPEPDFIKIWLTIGTMGLLFLAQLSVANKAMISSNFTTFEIARKMRLALGNKLQRLSLGYYKKRDPGDLAAVALQDVANFENIFGHSIPNIANAVFGTLILSVFLIFLNWKLGLTLVAALFIAIPFVQFGHWMVNKYGSKNIAARNATGANFLEYVQGLRHIKSYGMTGERFSSLDKSLNDLRKASIQTEAVSAPFVLLPGVIFEVTFVLMIWIALYLLMGASLTIPVLIAFLIIGYRLYEPVKILTVEYLVLSYMNVSLGRIREVIEADEQNEGKGLTPDTFNIEFEEVSFSYTGETPTLQEVSFSSPMSTMTALVGPSGSGKTTITSLLARFWDVDQGSIRIGGIDLRDMSPKVVYSLISEVFQEVYLFNGSIYQNIQIGNPNATEAELQQAAEKAQVLEFANQLPDGLQTLVGEGGSKLSGGQKQRISIARALIKDAPIVLLDEATASLDPENEIYIQQAIQELVQNKTVMVIAHKLATIQGADQILVLDEGRITESGTHEELLAKCGLYAHLWDTQQKAGGWKMEGNLRPV